MLKITNGKGFHMTFNNNWSISVQIGSGDYCDNYNIFNLTNKEAGKHGSKLAEVAILNPRNKMIEHPSFDGSNVGGFLTMDEILILMNWTANQ